MLDFPQKGSIIKGEGGAQMVDPGDKITLITQHQIIVCTVISIRERADQPTTSAVPPTHINHELQVALDPDRQVSRAEKR